MNIVIRNPKNTALNFMREAGYTYEKQKGDELAFIKRIGGEDFPKYHAYTKQIPGLLTISLHIDQKGPSYGTSPMHSGDYDSPLISVELERLKKITG